MSVYGQDEDYRDAIKTNGDLEMEVKMNMNGNKVKAVKSVQRVTFEF